jgi:hypothetical protein
MFKHFIVAKLPPLPPNSPSAELILFLWMNKIMYGLAFVLVLSTTYLFGLTRWAYNQLICRLLGPTLANAQRASLAYFLLKSCATMAIFSLFAWIFAFIGTLDENTAHAIVALADRVGIFLSIYGGYFVFSVLTLIATGLGIASVKICRMNGRAAMREIFLTDATSEQVMEVKLLLAATLFALMTFVPRLAGLRH